VGQENGGKGQETVKEIDRKKQRRKEGTLS
jgi:hypothetical protein